MKLIFDGEGNGIICQKIVESLLGKKLEEKTLIDICCGESPNINGIKMKRKIFIDNEDRGLNILFKEKDRFIKTDALSDNLIFRENFDISYAVDAIEHFHKEDGYKLLRKMEVISDRQIFFTPLGYLLVSPDSDHKSGWFPVDIPEGYAFIICPKWHESSWKMGGFWFWKVDNIEEDFLRVQNELKDILVQSKGEHCE